MAPRRKSLLHGLRSIPLFVSAVLLPALLTAQQPPDTSQVPAAAQRTRPYRRAEWFTQQRAYPQGYIPGGVREEALRQLDEMIANEARGKMTPSSVRGLSLANGSAPPASGTVWSPMGPQPTSNVFEDTPVSGRLSAIVVDPNTPTTMYVGGAMGGVWKSTDGGANWTALTDGQPTLAVGSMVLDPDNNQSIWVGTGESHFGADNYYGAGILKSPDGGTTWTQLAQSTFGQPVNSIPPTVGGAKIGSLAVLKGSSGQVAIAAVQFFQQSGLTPASGIYRTIDGGSTWTNVLNAAAGNVVAWDPNNASNCGSNCRGYATIGMPFGDNTNGFYVTTDSGQSWTRSHGGVVPTYPTANVGRMAMGLAKNTRGSAVQTTIYLGIGDSSTMDALGIWRSTDGGVTWIQVSTLNYCPYQCFYDNVIGVVPNNDFVVFAGGSFGNQAQTPAMMFRSIDGGANWTEISKPTGISFSALHADMHVISFSPDNTTVYLGSDGGIYKSANAPNPATAAANIAWSNLNGSSTDVTKSLALTQFYPGMSITSANYALGGTQDNGTQLFTGNLVWNEMTCGDGAWTAIDPNNQNTLYVACNSGPIDIEKSTSGTPGNGTFSEVTNGINVNDRAAFIPPLVMDPSNPQVLYFGSFKLYRTADGAGTWTAMASGADLTGGSNAHINAIGVGPSNTVWVGTSDAKVKVSNNASSGASATFTDRTSGLPNRAVTQVMPDFADSTGNTAYVTFSGFDQFGGGGGDGLGYVYKTINGGANWTNITGNLPHSPVNDIVVDPAAANTLYVANDVGVFQTTNGGSTWNTLVSGLPKSAVTSLKLHAGSRTLMAGTHGRSAWRALVGSLASAAPTSLGYSAQGFGSTSAPQAVTVSNTGSNAVTLNTISITLNGTEFAIATPSATRPRRTPACSNAMILAGGASCVVYVTFTPANAGARTGTLAISNTGAVSPLNVSLSGTGPTASVMSLLPNPVSFGNVEVNSSSTIPVTLSNGTGGGVQVGGFSLPAGYSQTNNCPATLNAGAGCTILVTFKPTSFTTFSGTLSVTDSGAGSPHTASVSGTGSDVTVGLSRPGAAAGSGTGIPSSLSTARPGRPTRSSANQVIAGKAAMVPIVFSPDGATGTVSLSCFGAPDGTTCAVQPSSLTLRGKPEHANVVLGYSDSPDAAPPGPYQVQILASSSSFSSVLAIPIELVSGQAVPQVSIKSENLAADKLVRRSSDEPAAPAFEFSATRLEFGAQDRKPDAAAREIKVTNLTAAPLSVSIESITGDFVQTNDCGAELLAGASCRIAVRMKTTSLVLSSGVMTIRTGAGTATVELNPVP